MDEEEEEPSEEGEANMDNTTANPLTISKIMPRPWETRQTPASNVDKWDTTPENALKDNDVRRVTGRPKWPT